jgi:protein-ribulosamine 3-kinase
MHRSRGERFGWARDNYIGSTPQANTLCASWAQFWREHRLRPQLELARRNGYAIDVGNVADLLEAHGPQPSLVHGDLWSGNIGFLSDGAPVLFDPAVYYGDREVDLAMTGLFGGFPPEFYSAYEKAWPLPAGQEVRKHLYNLYHLLNHLNLFGRGYFAQVNSTLRLLARSL